MLLYVQTIGRLGDLVNGEHCAKAADYFLAFKWTHPETTAVTCANDLGLIPFAHPVIAYEMTANIVALAIIWRLRGRLRPDGMLFAMYLAFYSLSRFGITFMRDDRVWALGMQEAQYIAIAVLLITVPMLIVKRRWISPEQAIAGPVAEPQDRGTRAQRRRRGRRH